MSCAPLDLCLETQTLKSPENSGKDPHDFAGANSVTNHLSNLKQC